MENLKLNNLVSEYQKSKCEVIFGEIYNACLSDINKSLVSSSRRQGIAAEDMIEIYEDCLLKAIEKYEGRGNFRNFYNTLVINKRIDASRKSKTVKKHEFHYEDLSKSNEDPNEATFEIASDFDLEQTVTQKKKADQWLLIDSLLKDSDATTKAIVEAYMTLPKPSPLAVEKATGICRKKVSRKLNRLAARFSTKQFGDYADYLIAL